MTNSEARNTKSQRGGVIFGQTCVGGKPAHIHILMVSGGFGTRLDPSCPEMGCQRCHRPGLINHDAGGKRHDFAPAVSFRLLMRPCLRHRVFRWHKLMILLGESEQPRGAPMTLKNKQKEKFCLEPLEGNPVPDHPTFDRRNYRVSDWPSVRISSFVLPWVFGYFVIRHFAPCPSQSAQFFIRVTSCPFVVFRFITRISLGIWVFGYFVISRPPHSPTCR